MNQWPVKMFPAMHPEPTEELHSGDAADGTFPGGGGVTMTGRVG